ncbi:virginiamycin B lyase family protein [Nocardia pseudobrasiliensis]|uniref:NHL repeat-containing protein n=1 Tax=Nocardia pseudobrasiliensis TaxID=45979 RepID=A0A370I6Q3_9NOCA|nr:hypothetical protein [Nocardia pseudobrasiliensis]RDI65781.1 hypothetical protein DFR76_10596 [Nocardia pseudobrasiliensis]
MTNPTYTVYGRPTGVALDAAGNIYATGNLYDQVWKFTPQGAETKLPVAGARKPSAVAVDAAGNVYIANSQRGSEEIIRLRPNGAQQTIRVPELRKPTQLRFDSAGNLYVVDGYAGRIVRIAPNGVQETVPIQLDYPYALHIDRAGAITVTMMEPSQVVRFETDGTRTVLPFTNLDQPTGLDIDSDGNVYVALAAGALPGDPRVLKLTPSGEQSVLPVELSNLVTPGNLVVRDGVLYIADGLSAIQTLKL